MVRGLKAVAVGAALLLCAGSALAAVSVPTLAKPVAEPLSDSPAEQPSPEPTATRPESAGRLTRLFDFDEPTPNPVPNFWFRSLSEPGSPREGFPPTNLAELDDNVFASGTTSMRLPTRGGSTALVLSPGVLPVFSSADYRVSAKVRTQGIVSARAVLIARFLDASSKPIRGTERISAPITSETGWADIAVLLPGDYEDAAYLQIELQLLQPKQLRAALNLPPPGKHVAYAQDFSGAAWFDDVAVMQLAKIELVAGDSANIFAAPAVPVLHARVRDLTGEVLRGRVTITDINEKVVSTVERVLGAGRADLTVTPDLPGYGWYRASLEVMSGDRTVGYSATDFVHLPPRSPMLRDESVDAKRLSLYVESLPPNVSPDLMDRLVSELAVGSIALPLWTDDLTRETVGDRAVVIASQVDKLLRNYREMTLVLADPPSGSLPASGQARTDPWTVLEQDRTVYWPYIDQFLDRFGQRIHRWQIGQAGSETAVWRKDLPADLAKLEREFGQLISAPVLGVGSRAEFAVSPASVSGRNEPGMVASLVGCDLPSWAVGEAVRAWRAEKPGSHADLTMVLDRPTPELYARSAALGDTCRKLIEGWAAAADAKDRTNDDSVRLGLKQPWTWTGSRVARPQPTPEFAAFRAMADQLADRVAIGEFPAIPGVRCIILAPTASAPQGRGGALVLWNESASAQDAVFEAHLGGGAIHMVDHFGNRTQLQAADAPDRPASDTVISASSVTPIGLEQAAPTVRFNVPQTPIFIEGIDVELVRLIASVRLSPDFLPATTQRKDLTIEFDNPWPNAISGEITVVEPIGGGVSTDGLDRSWKIVPRVLRFAVNPGEHASLPLSVAFGGLEEAGRRDFVFLMDISAERRLKGIKVRAPVSIGLKHIKLELTPSLFPTSAGPDAVVEVQITNLGETALDLEVTAFAPKRPRASATVGGLQPGHQTVRRFVFPGAARALRGQRVLVSITEPEGGTRLNASTQMP